MKFDTSQIKEYKIGHRTCTVKRYKGLVDGKYLGLMNSGGRVIKLQGGRHKEEETETFFHEVVHSINSVSGDKMSEAQVMRMGSLLAQAIMTMK